MLKSVSDNSPGFLPVQIWMGIEYFLVCRVEIYPMWQKIRRYKRRRGKSRKHCRIQSEHLTQLAGINKTAQ